MSWGSDLILTMDADFSHDPKYIPELISKAGEYDLVIGSRYIEGGGTVNWGIIRKTISRTANLVAKALLGFENNDRTAGFRCYRREVLEVIDLDNIFSDGYSFLVEMLYKCKQKGFKIGEIPIIFVDRRAGRSKISKREIYKAVYTILRLRFGSS
jgi:dolichol-phosphate mannosyltransferase